MFKILSMALISLVGMQYANTMGDNILRLADSPVVYGGIDYESITNNFLIPCESGRFSYDGPDVPSDSTFNYYQYSFYFTADYLYFRSPLVSSGDVFDTRDVSYRDKISSYSLLLQYNYINDDFYWNLRGLDIDNNNLFNYTIAYYSFQASTDKTGLELFYDNLSSYTFYVSGFNFVRFGDARFFGYNNGELITHYAGGISHSLPFEIDTRYRSLERNFYFPYQPVVYGYWYKDQNSTYYINTLGNVGSISRPTIFKGYFKCNGEHFMSYLLDGVNNQQPGSGGWFFGPYNNVSSLSSAIRPSTGSTFWFANGGLFQYFNNVVKSVWYTMSTPVVSSNVEYNVISNTYQWYSYFYQNVYLVYEEVDTSGNLTSIEDLSYYDMLSFNTGFIATETDINPLTNALTLVGVAFQQLWSIGNIVLFGSITINALILVPILISLVLFIIHLIKKG